MTFPGVAATFLPTWYCSAPTGGWPNAKRCQSSNAFWNPCARLRPPCSRVTRPISGFVHGKLDGEAMSSSCRVMNETTAWLRLERPSISVVALCHHCWSKRNDWYIRLYGHPRQPSSLKRRSWGSGSIQGGVSGSAAAFAAYIARRAAFRPAFSMSCNCLPGASIKCVPQSKYARARPAGVIPCVTRARFALKVRSSPK